MFKQPGKFLVTYHGPTGFAHTLCSANTLETARDKLTFHRRQKDKLADLIGPDDDGTTYHIWEADWKHVE